MINKNESIIGPLFCIVFVFSILASMITFLLAEKVQAKNKTIIDLRAENAQLKSKLSEKEHITIEQKYNFADSDIVRQTIKNIIVTSYNNHSEQTDDTPNITATNRPVREGIVAVSQDLLKKDIAHYGDLMYISCFDKWYTIEDTMNKRFENRVDIFLFDKKESLKINKRCDIEIIHYKR